MLRSIGRAISPLGGEVYTLKEGENAHLIPYGSTLGIFHHYYGAHDRYSSTATF